MNEALKIHRELVKIADALDKIANMFFELIESAKKEQENDEEISTKKNNA